MDRSFAKGASSGSSQAELRTHKLHQLADGLLRLDLGIALVACEPGRDDPVIPRCAVEDGFQNRWRLGRRCVRRCACEVLICDAFRRQHLVDDAVSVALTEDIARQPLQLRLIAFPGLFELHQHRAVAIAFAARQVDDHALRRRIPADEGLHDRAQLEHRAVVFRQARCQAADGDGHGLIARPRATPQFRDKRREFAARIVPNDDLPGLQLLGELLRNILMQGVHQLRPPLSTLESS